ncbi:MAG: peptidoglycan DD-metalloendopeptidase family protein, partial [Gammaproteobacteria bacterium]|nr:peptidoglycan DD-metalloendopeptidase family protein [Gammaproteobacteria bacterium]
ILDIREGDAFSMIYEEKFIDGEKIGYGDILVAEFVNQGKSYRAVRYTNSKGKSDYYTPDGLSMRKAFLRAPLNFSYISSNFNPKRFHPILKKTRAHNGIDYRAPTGTPVRAAGDGKVIASSYNQYNGKYIFIQHGQGIVTKYLHLSRRAVSKNKRVRQGQVIGYVGSTGMSEAPHLHYEFVVNGVHRNPRTVKLPQAKPIDKQEKVLFEAQTDKLFVQLDSRNSLQGNSQSFAQ